MELVKPFAKGTLESIIAQTLGYVFHEEGRNLNASVSCYQSACMLTPTDMDVYINLGSVFYDQNEFDKKFENTLIKLRGFRNLIVHEYGKIDTESVYKTSVNDVPVFIKDLEEELKWKY